MNSKTFLIFFAVSVLATVGRGEIITVDDNHPADFTSIQDAIDFSSDEDVIEVQPGIYYEKTNFYNKAVTGTGTDPER